MMTNAPSQADESGDAAALSKNKKKIPTTNQNISPPETDNSQSKFGEDRRRDNGRRFGKDPKLKNQGRRGQRRTSDGDHNKNFTSSSKHITTRHDAAHRQWGSTEQRHISKNDVSITNDFSKLVNTSKAARYKVHRPGCECSKVSNLLLKNKHQEEGLLVLPDIKAITSIFVGGTGSFRSFLLDPLGHEQTLKKIIFPSSQIQNRTTTIKVSCASCILNIEPNGFVCISSSSKADIVKAKDMAQSAKEYAIESGVSLHSDHAHSMCIMERHLLHRSAKVLNPNRRSRTQPPPIPYELEQDLISQCALVLDGDETITIGHHLCTMLDILKEKQREEYTFILTMVTKTTKGKHTIYEIDLPGGKRHLGETSFDCAVRETLEETSLAIDASWLIGSGESMKSKGAYESGNVFYLAKPPTREGDKDKSDVVDIVSDVFWTNTGLGMERKEPS